MYVQDFNQTLYKRMLRERNILSHLWLLITIKGYTLILIVLKQAIYKMSSVCHMLRIIHDIHRKECENKMNWINT